MDVPVNAVQLPPKAVIYATDFSSYSENAGRYVSLLARHFDADLMVAHAFLLSQAAEEVEAESNPPQKSAQRRELESALAAVAQRFGEGAKRVVPVLLDGDPREKIPRLAMENAPSLLVLGTHGRGRVERGITGSVAERVLRATDGPSLTVGPDVPALQPGTQPFRHILFATGLSAASVRGAAYAKAMAQTFHARLDVLHVAHPEDMEDPGRMKEIREHLTTTLESVLPGEAWEALDPKGAIETGRAHRRILDYIHGSSVDLLVLALRKSSHQWLQPRLSGAFHIVANAPCPVMTITG